MTTGILQNVASLALSVARDMAGVAVTYYRAEGGAGIAIAKAGVGRTNYTEAGGDNVEVGLTERDYLVAVSDLAQDSIEFPPREGDWIEEISSGKRYTYAVMPVGGVGEAAVWSDPGRTQWRIHSQLDSVEEV